MKLDVNYIARRQRELGLSRRDMASAMNVSFARITSLHNGKHHGSFNLTEMGRLADVLACHPRDLLLRDHTTAAAATDADSLRMQVIGALLQAAKSPVTTATLAKATASDLPQIEAALSHLATDLKRVGLGIRRNTLDRKSVV